LFSPVQFGIFLVIRRRLSFALVLMAGLMPAGFANAASDLTQLAQAQPAPQAPAAPATPAPDPAAPAADTQPPEEPIGNVAIVTGTATVTRNNAAIPLRLKDDIFLNDVVQTAAGSSLGITFSDGTTFNLKANAQITIDTFVYEDGGKQNVGVFDVAKGTVAFVAAAVAKTGDMKITTPTATLGIRGTSGLVEVPAGASATAANNVAIKLYPDADGRVGRIEVNDRAGARLGFLTQGSSGFTIRPGSGGARFAAVPLVMTPQMVARDQGFVRQVHSTQILGRRVFDEQRAFRRANPGFVNPNRPIRSGQPGQPGGPQRQNGLPGQNRRGAPQQPGLQNRPGQQQPGAPNRQDLQPRPSQPQQPGQPNQTPRPGQPQQPSQPGRQGLQQPGTPQPGPQQGTPANPVGPAQPRVTQPGGQPPLPQQGGGQLRQGGVPGGSGLQRPGPLGRPGLQLPRRPAAPALAPKGKKPPREVR
jgi:FecR-like protein